MAASLQTGGDDQWSNMLSGADLIRRKEQKPAFAMTFKLLLTHDGRKMGKTEKGALWLDPNKYLALRFLPVLAQCGRRGRGEVPGAADLPAHGRGAPSGRASRHAEINEAKRVLAFEVTKIIHGEEEAVKAQHAAEALFGGGRPAAACPPPQISRRGACGGGRACVALDARRPA